MKHNKSAYGQRTLAGAGLLICSGLLLLAVPRLISSCYALYPEMAYQKNQVTPLTPDIYERCISNLEQALSWHQSAYDWQQQGFFYLKLFNLQPFQAFEKKRELLKNAQTAINNGLALSPVDPFGWFQLATVDKTLKNPKINTIDALRLSFYSGRVEPDLVMSRLAFSYNYYADFDEDLRQQWQKQLLTAWTFKGPELITFVTQHPETKELALQAFVYAPDDADKFLHALEIALKKPI